MPHLCSLAGLTFSVPFPLTGFATESPVDVTVRHGEVPASLPDAVGSGRRFQAAPGRWLFAPADGTRFLVQDGRRVVYDPGPADSLEAVAGHLVQRVLTALLHQRRRLPLHGSAVEIGGQGVALLGDSGAGKSTLAGWLHAHGGRMLCDDVCPVEVDPEPRILGGTPFLKLTREAARRLALEGEFRDLHDGDRGRSLVVLERLPPPPVPLRRVFVLAPQASETRPEVRELAPPQAFEALLNQIIRRRYLWGLDLWDVQMAACSRIPTASVRELRFSRGLGRLDEVGERLLEECSR